MKAKILGVALALMLFGLVSPASADILTVTFSGGISGFFDPADGGAATDNHIGDTLSVTEVWDTSLGVLSPGQLVGGLVSDTIIFGNQVSWNQGGYTGPWHLRFDDIQSLTWSGDFQDVSAAMAAPAPTRC
jgi:hypothetical protein